MHQIYVQLLEEGLPVWRPVTASKLSEQIFIITGVPGRFDPDDEVWEFPLGSTVVVEEVEKEGGKVLIAVGLATS